MLTFLFRTVDGYRVDTVTDAAEFPFADNFSILQRLVAMFWEDVRILSSTSITDDSAITSQLSRNMTVFPTFIFIV